MTIKMTDLHWAAGFIEGEGSFCFRGQRCAVVSVGQNNIEPIVKLVHLFGGIVSKGSDGKINVWNLNGKKGIALMMTLYPLMSMRRQGQIRQVIEKWKAKGKPRLNLGDEESLALMRRICHGEPMSKVAEGSGIEWHILSHWMHGRVRPHLLERLKLEFPDEIFAKITERREKSSVANQASLERAREAMRKRRLGYSYDKIATELGVSPTTVGRWVSGKTRSIPPVCDQEELQQEVLR